MIPGNRPVPSNRTRTFRTITIRMPVTTHNKLIEARDKQNKAINTVALEAINKHLGVKE